MPRGEFAPQSANTGTGRHRWRAREMRQIGGPVWTPPEGFAQRNALRGSRLVVQASTRPRERIVPRALRAATLGVLVAAATYWGADALDTLAPVTGEFVLDHTETVLDAYARAFGGAATTVVASVDTQNRPLVDS